MSAGFVDANQSPRRLPAGLEALLSRLPQWPPTLALAAVLRIAVARRLLDVQALQPLTGKIVELRITDAGARLRLRFTGRVFVPACNNAVADVMISATAYDFSLLAQRKADPDSLFFRRRLIMEGDTELGLLVKNTLDAMDMTRLFPFPFNGAP